MREENGDMVFRLREEEIRIRLGKLHNYEKVLYPQLKERSDRLPEENKELKMALSEQEKSMTGI